MVEFHFESELSRFLRSAGWLDCEAILTLAAEEDIVAVESLFFKFGPFCDEVSFRSIESDSSR